MAAPMNMALYHLLRKQGADEREAEEAARIDTSELVTKAHLDARLAELKADLQRTLITVMLAQAAIFGGIVGALKLFT